MIMTPEEYTIAIDKAFLNFRDHEAMTKQVITQWINQFPREVHPTAVKVLSNVDYFSAEHLRQMTNQLVGSIFSQYKNIHKNSVFFFPIGGIGSGAQIIARFIKEAKGVVPTNVVQLSDIEKIPATEIKVAVFFDDFSGTGQTIKNWWDNVEQLILPKTENIVLGLLVINCQSLDRLGKEIPTTKILYSKRLRAGKNIFNRDCLRFTKQEKAIIVAACKKTGCDPDYVYGYGKSGLLIAFKHGCPNNSLPILWYSNRRWRRLFRRRTI